MPAASTASVCNFIIIDQTPALIFLRSAYERLSMAATMCWVRLRAKGIAR